MTATRLYRLTMTTVFLTLLAVLGSGTANAADPYGSLSERILGDQLSGAYEIEIVGATFANDSAFAVSIAANGAPAPDGTTVSFLLAPQVASDSLPSGFGSAAAATVFTPEQEQAAVPTTRESADSWILNPAPLDQEGRWKGRILVDGPAGPATAGFSFNVYPARPTLPIWVTLGQPLVPVVVLGLALWLIQARRTPLMRAPAPAPASIREPA